MISIEPRLSSVSIIGNGGRKRRITLRAGQIHEGTRQTVRGMMTGMVLSAMIWAALAGAIIAIS